MNPIICGHAISDVRKTQYPELGYLKVGMACWRVIDLSDNPAPDDSPIVIGPQYRTKTELLADLNRFAKVYGCG